MASPTLVSRPLKFGVIDQHKELTKIGKLTITRTSRIQRRISEFIYILQLRAISFQHKCVMDTCADQNHHQSHKFQCRLESTISCNNLTHYMVGNVSASFILSFPVQLATYVYICSYMYVFEQVKNR